MKVRKNLKRLWFPVVLALFASTPCSAKNNGVMTLLHDVTLHGKTLPAGPYLVEWKTHSPQATVMFQSAQPAGGSSIGLARSIVFVANGRVQKRTEVYDFNAVVFTTGRDGARNLIEIRFAGSDKVLVFDK